MGTVSIDNWTGKLVGADGTDYRLISAGARVSVPYNRNSGAGCLGLWRMDEAAWDGTVGEVVDVKSLSNGQAFDGVTTTADGMTRCGSFGPDTGGTKYVSLPYAAGYAGAQFAFGCWLKWDGAGGRMLFTRNGANAAHWGFFVYVTPDGALQLRTYTVSQAVVNTADGVIPSGEWVYCAASYDGSAQFVYVYSGAGLVSARLLRTGNLRGGSSASHIGKYFGVSNAATLLIDEAATWSTGQAQSVFDALSVRQSTGSLRTAASAVDSTVPGAVWQSVNVTIAAPTSDEAYSLYLAPSDSSTVPDVSDPAWTLIGSGLTASASIDVSGLGLAAGQYGHLRAVPGVSSDAIHQYAIEFGALSMEYNAPSTAITEAAPWTIGATATLTVRDVSGEQFASNGRRAQSYLPSIGRLAQEFFASGGRRAQDYLPTKGGRG